MAKRKKQKHARSHRTTDGTFDINPEMPDIAGSQVQLQVKERDLGPFFKSLLEKNTPLPKHVSFCCYDEPTMSETVIGFGVACVTLFIPGNDSFAMHSHRDRIL